MLNPDYPTNTTNGPGSALGAQDLIDVYLGIRPQLERVIARHIGSRSVAADLAQEMFFKIETIKAALPTRIDAERYFVGAATNAALNYLKIEARRRALLHASHQAAAEAEPLASPSPERIALARDELRRIDAALAELPEKCRLVFVMSRTHGLSHAQIAAELGVSHSLIEKYVIRALLHCRARLAD